MAQKKTRKAVWRECIWCKARGNEPTYKSGKLKVLERHMVSCKAAFHLEQQNLAGLRPKIDTVLSMVQLQQKQIADLTARVAVLEQRKSRPVDPTNYWFGLSAKECWKHRKRNAVRWMRGVLSQYEPKPYHKTIWDYFEWYIPTEPTIHTILNSALWPCIEMRNGQACLRGIETEDMYCIFKNIWGKSLCRGTNLDWYLEALQEVGVPPKQFDRVCIANVAENFENAIRRFQATKKRAGDQAPQGLVRLVRIWRKYEFDEQINEVCSRLPPQTVQTWEISTPADRLPEESTTARDDSMSVLGPQSRSDTLLDYVEVRSS